MEEKLDYAKEFGVTIDLMAKVGLFSVLRGGATDGTGIFKDINRELSVDEVFERFETKLNDDDPQVKSMFWNEDAKISKVKELIRSKLYRKILKTYWEVRGEDPWNIARNNVCSVQDHLHQEGFPNEPFKSALFDKIIASN